jgi:hypothetical protein
LLEFDPAWLIFKKAMLVAAAPKPTIGVAVILWSRQ